MTWVHFHGIFEGGNYWERGNWEPRNDSSSSIKMGKVASLYSEGQKHPSTFPLGERMQPNLHNNHLTSVAFLTLHLALYVFIQWAFIDCLLYARKRFRATKEKVPGLPLSCVNKRKSLLSYLCSVYGLQRYYLRVASSLSPITVRNARPPHVFASFPLTHHYWFLPLPTTVYA